MRGIKRKRLTLILTIGVLLVFASIFYLRYFIARPIGSGPAGPSVDSSAFDSVWTDRRVYLAGIGDSITAGLGAKSTHHTFFNRLVRNPQDEFEDMRGLCLSAVLPNLTTENLAVSGSTSEHHLATITDRLKSQPEDVYGLIVITTGGNDLIHSYGRSAPRECAMYGATLAQAQPWIDSFRERLSEMLDSIDDCFPGGCEIYLANIYDPTDGVGDAPSVYLPHWPDGLAIHAEYNAIIQSCVKSRPNVHIVPLYEGFLGHGSHCRQFWRRTYDKTDPHYWYYENIEDPNDRGYDAIRRLFLNAIVENSQLRH
jgi:lysophospholipase L1-like esterase